MRAVACGTARVRLAAGLAAVAPATAAESAAVGGAVSVCGRSSQAGQMGRGQIVLVTAAAGGTGQARARPLPLITPFSILGNDLNLPRACPLLPSGVT